MFLSSLHNSTRCTGKLSLNVFKTSLRNPGTSTASLLRNYATSKPPPKSPPRRAPPTKLPTPTRSAGRPAVSLSENSISRKTQAAQRLFNAGDRTLYQSGKRTTFFRAFAFSLTAVGALGITALYASGFLKLETFQDLGHDTPILVFSAFAITGVFLGAAAGWSLQRTWKHVHRLDLVQKSGSIFVQVTVRAGIPFTKRRFLVQPQDMAVDSRWLLAYTLPSVLVPVAPTESSPSVFVGGVLREGLKYVSRFFYSIFEGARVFFTQEGIMTIEITQENKGKRSTEKYFLDTSADFLQEKDNKIVLWDLVETKDPFGY